MFELSLRAEKNVPQIMGMVISQMKPKGFVVGVGHTLGCRKVRPKISQKPSALAVWSCSQKHTIFKTPTIETEYEQTRIELVLPTVPNLPVAEGLNSHTPFDAPVDKNQHIATSGLHEEQLQKSAPDNNYITKALLISIYS